MTPKERLKAYSPVVLIMGERKDNGKLESVLVVEKGLVKGVVDEFVAYRAFELLEIPVQKFKDSLK